MQVIGSVKIVITSQSEIKGQMLAAHYLRLIIYARCKCKQNGSLSKSFHAAKRLNRLEKVKEEKKKGQSCESGYPSSLALHVSVPWLC